MTGKVEHLDAILEEDELACRIADRWLDYDNRRAIWKTNMQEVNQYLYATDTTMTSNAQLPWKNRTTIPKLTQIHDNLLANYIATSFPTRKSITWEANEKDANSAAKRDAIVNYTNWMIEQPMFKQEIYKSMHDFLQMGNTMVTVEWIDQRVQLNGKTQAGYVGPGLRRINPFDIVMNPTAPHFIQAPKIIKSVVGMGEVKEMLERLSTDETREAYENLWKYLKEVRGTARNYQGDWVETDLYYRTAGFTSFREYLMSDYVELLTFYGDVYDPDTDTFLKNHVITIVDRHKVIEKKPNPSFFGYPPIFHSCWRKRQDNLWGQGPLENLVGMQYRMDHVENMKADIFDLVTYPVQMITGFVEEFDWRPGEKIYCSEEGKVELVTPDVNVLQANFEIDAYERRMEEMAGAPKEALGIRSPGEKTKYEVQRLENASSRLYQSKIRQFEEEIIEPVLNAMLELARRNMSGATTIKVFDDEFKVASFQSLSVEDISGAGRIKPLAARHFAERAELIQNLTSLTGSGLWPTVQPHFSSIKLAKIVEEMFDLKDLEVVIPYVAITEKAEAQKIAQATEEQLMMQTQTASGIGEDYDLNSLQQSESDQQFQQMMAAGQQ